MTDTFRIGDILEIDCAITGNIISTPIRKVEPKTFIVVGVNPNSYFICRILNKTPFVYILKKQQISDLKIKKDIATKMEIIVEQKRANLS